MPASWYDAGYGESAEYRKHYTQSVYWPVWTLALDRISRRAPKSVLEIGCGPGQFARALLDWLPVSYLGFDFSETAINLARRSSPDGEFLVEDIFRTTLYARPVDLVIAFEVLEHVEDDFHVIESLPAGRRFIGSVPNFDSQSHVRWFDSVCSVAARYQSRLDELEIVKVPTSPEGACIFIFEGIVSDR